MISVLPGEIQEAPVWGAAQAFADRHGHAWLKRLDKTAIDLGKGKRRLVPGGKLDPAYLITVPKDLNAVS